MGDEAAGTWRRDADAIGRSVGRNLSALFVAQVFTWVSSFVLLLFLPKYLGAVDYGRLFVALSIREIISVVIDFGGSHLIPREIARDPKGREGVVHQFVLIRGLLWLACTVLVVLFALATAQTGPLFVLVMVLLVGNLLESVIKTLRAYFQGIESMNIPSKALIFEKVTVAAATVGVLLAGGDSKAVAAVFVAGILLHLLVLLRLSSPVIRLKPLQASHSWREVRIAAPFVLWSVFSILYFRIDALMLGAMSPDQVTGWYGGAYRFFDAVMIIPSLLKAALYPVFSRLVSDPGKTLAPMFEASVRMVLLVAIPLSCLMWAAAPHIIDLFMGLSDYAPAVTILRIFSIGIPLMFVDFILVGALIASSDRLRSWVWVGAWAIVLNVGLNLVLIPQAQIVSGNGAAGAAIATVVTEGFILVSAIRHLPKVMFQRFDPMRYGRIVTIGAALAGLSFWLSELDAHWAVLVTVLPLCALAGAWSFSLLSGTEWRFLATLLQTVMRRVHKPTPSKG